MRQFRAAMGKGLVALTLLTGVAGGASAQTPRPAPTAAPVAKSTVPHANELGRIPIFMYHSVGDPVHRELERRLGLAIPAAQLRSNLEAMYKAGFYPVNMRDILTPRIDVPAGKTPVVLTFDDARASQFRYHKDGTLDPNCAMGVLEAFHKSHPDWPERATFYVLPYSKFNPIPFGQAGSEIKKIKYLVDHGYEIANHSTSHRPLSRLDGKTLAWEMGYCAKYFQSRVPQATMDTMALPYGISPSKSLLPVLLSDGSGAYHNRCILLAAGDAYYSPADKRFDKMRIQRVGSEPGNIERWIKALRAGRGAVSSHAGVVPAYVSDGDPATLTTPASLAKYLNKNSLGALRVAVWNDPQAKPARKTATSPKKPARPKAAQVATRKA